MLMRTISNNKVMFNLFPASSFMCYSCGPKSKGESYTTAQCEKDQKVVDCNSTGVTCMKGHSTKTDDNEVELRSCSSKEVCEGAKEMCKGSQEEKEKVKVKECQVACCETDLCNSAFMFSGSIAMMTAAMFSLVLF